MPTLNFDPIILDLMLSGGILLIFLADLFVTDLKNDVAYLAAGICATVFVASFQHNTEGFAIFASYEGGAWPLMFKRIFLVAGFLTALGSAAHVNRAYPNRQSEYYMLMLCSLLGMMLLAGARDLILLIVSFELMGLPLYILAAYGKNNLEIGERSPEAALKLFLVGAVSTVVMLFGVSLIFGMAGSTDIATIAATPASPLVNLGILLILGGMGFKIGVVPFHMWVPDTYQGSGTPFVAFLSVAPKVAGFAAMSVLFLKAFLPHVAIWQPPMIGLAAATLLIGNLLALSQDNVKRLLAFSGVAQIGYMLMAFAAADEFSVAMLLFYAAGYTVTNMGAFLVVQAVSADGGDGSLSSFEGLHSRKPWLALAMLLFLLSLAGIPFVVGFWAKFYVFIAVWKAGFPWLVVLGAVLAVVALFYYLQVVRAIYMKPPTTKRTFEVDFPLGLAIATCLVFVVGMGAWPAPFVDAALEAVKPFFS